MQYMIHHNRWSRSWPSSRGRRGRRPAARGASGPTTPNLPTNIVDFRGFYSSIILILRVGIPRFIGDFPESLSQAMLVGTTLVGRLGVSGLFRDKTTRGLFPLYVCICIYIYIYREREIYTHIWTNLQEVCSF